MKKIVIVHSRAGISVPNMGRLGMGEHVDIELTDKQVKAIVDSGHAELMTPATHKKTKKG